MSLFVAGARIVSGEPAAAPFVGSVRIDADRITEVGADLTPRGSGGARGKP